jgi:hypothetical protein
MNSLVELLERIATTPTIAVATRDRARFLLFRIDMAAYLRALSGL